MSSIILQEVNSDNIDFIYLCKELDRFLNQAIGGEAKREKYKIFNRLDTMDYVVLAYDNQIPVGCAALRKYSDKEIEIKRVFVCKEYRGKNIGGIILERLISQAKAWNYKRMILETGEFLESSVRLYMRYGFEAIPNYGEYKNMTESFCMGRSIVEHDVTYCVNRWIMPEAIQELFESVGWISAGYANQLSMAFRKAGTVISAWKNNKLIGLIEVLDDGELNAYIHYLLVNPAYQQKGVGSSLIEKVKHKYKDYLYLVVICENKNTVPFYEDLNFSVAEGATPLQIRNL